MRDLPKVKELTAGQVRQLFRSGNLDAGMAELLATPEGQEPVSWEVMAAMVEGGEAALEPLSLAEYEELSRMAREVNADFFSRVGRVTKSLVEAVSSTSSTPSSTDSSEPDTPAA